MKKKEQEEEEEEEEKEEEGRAWDLNGIAGPWCTLGLLTLKVRVLES
jgi:hypothetical protein